MILSISAPVAAGPGGDDRASSTGAIGTQGVDASANGQWADPPAEDDEGEANETITFEQRAAVDAGVDEAVATLQRQGVSVNQSQRAAAVNGTLAAVVHHQNASVELTQNASYGAITGTFLQSGNVSLEQIQNATAGGASGALSQHQNASAIQLQHAAHGATHGAVAQAGNATAEQVQVVAQGAAAGAAHEAGKHVDNDSKKAHPGAIREAAQGAAFGALAQKQNVTIEQRQYAAVGAAEGALNQSQSVRVEQTQTASIGNNRTASVKQIQVAAMGAAKGSLSITQRQDVTVRQVQAAARGACKGALSQVQNVSLTQIQASAFGAATGAISQSQQASVTQIQAAATGGAKGAIAQRQTVSITQVQYAAWGAAKGAARSAAQNQVVNVEQIQAAAVGAGEGSIVQIQQINVVQIQVISESAAEGALSQHQEATVVQIQSAARGASEGSLSLTQRQEVNIEQTRIVTQRAAAETAATAARLNIDVDVTIYNYAKGSSEDPEDPVDEDDGLRSLFASSEGSTIFLANPNDVAVTVTITSDDGDLETVTMAAGESTSVERDRGTYTLTAETADGEDVELAGRDELRVSVGDALQSLDADVDDGTLTVENPNAERVTVDVDGEREFSFDVPGNWGISQSLGPGTYTLTAAAQDGESVPVNDEDEFQFTIEPEEPEPLEAVELNASVDGGNLTVENPSETDVEATVSPEEGGETTFDVPAGDTVTETFDSGAYTLTGEAEDDREVRIDGQSEFEFTVEPPAVEPIDLNASVEDGALTVENPSDVDVAVALTAADGDEQSFDVPAGDQAERTLDPGAYTLTGEPVDDREVLVNGQAEYEFSIDEPSPIDLTVTVDEATVSIENPSDSDVSVTATHETTETRTIQVGAGENVTVTLTPGDHILTGESDDREVLLDGESELTVAIDEPTEELASLNVSVQGGNVTLDNPNDESVSVTANATDAENRTVDVDSESNATEGFEPGTYTLTAATADGTVVPIHGETEYELVVEPSEPTATGTLTVADQSGDGTEFVVDNASASVPFALELDYATGTGISEPFDADETLSNATFALDPPIESDGNVTVTVRATETDESLANETVAYDVAGPAANVSVDDQTTDGSAVVVQSANLTDGGFLAIHGESTNGTDDVLGTSTSLTPGEHENVTVALESPPGADATVNVTAHRDTNGNEAFDFVTTFGTEDEPYVNEANEPVSENVTLTVGTEPEPGMEYVNCTTAQVTGTYDRLGVTLDYYAQDGNTTSTHVRTATNVQGGPPVDGETLVTVGETNETTMTDDGGRVVQIADPGAFGDADPTTVDERERSVVANVNTSESPTGQEDLSVAQPNVLECRENVRPESPTLAVESVEAVDNETAVVNLSAVNPNDTPMEPAESLFTSGAVLQEPPATLDPGQQFVEVQWTPASPDEDVTWTVNLSNFDLANGSTTGPTAAEVPGLLEPPDETQAPGPGDGIGGDDVGPEDAPEDAPPGEQPPVQDPDDVDTPTPDEGPVPGDSSDPQPDDSPDSSADEPLPDDVPAIGPDDTPTPENETA